MRLAMPTAALLALGSRAADASTIPLMKRTIYPPSEYTMPGKNISSIMSWTYTALAYATITISNSTSDLTYLCTNFDDLSSRYYTAFAQPDGDVAKLAKDAICDASKSSNPSPLPVSQNMLWWMKVHTAGVFNVQAYAAKKESTQWYMDMCYYLEASLLRGLWAPCRETGEGAVDVESGFCSAAGYFGKGPYSTYTDALQPVDVARQADVLMSKVMARVFKLVAKDTKHIEYVCSNWEKFEARVQQTGLVADAVKELICGKVEVVEVKQAKSEMLSQMTDLFIFQALNAGNYEGYYAYMCSTFGVDILNKYGLDGAKVVDAVCKAAN